MAKRSRGRFAGLSLSEMRKVLAARQKRLSGLRRREAQLGKQLDELRGEISELDGAPRRGRPLGRRGPGRPKKVKRRGPGRPKAKRRGGPPKRVARRPGRPRKVVRRGRRRRSGVTIADALVRILKSASKPLRVGDMADALARSGHPTKSKNLPRLVAVTVKTSNAFKRVDRGLYTAK